MKTIFIVLFLGLAFIFSACAQGARMDESKLIDSLNLKVGKSVSSFNLSAGEKGKAPTVTLNSGYAMPVVGLGTYSLLDGVCVNSVVHIGGIDLSETAYMYNNEKSVVEGIKKSGVPRLVLI